MAYYRTPMQVAEPYEESQQDESPSEPSPEVMKAYYQEMERKETLERKLSKRKSGSGTSIWSRKSLKRSNTTNPVSPPPTRTVSSDVENFASKIGRYEERKQEQNKKSDFVGQLSSSRSVIPETNREMPASSKDAWASVPLPAYKVRYHIHNPLGPRWYKNYHLIPPSQMKPGMRPPSFFSPSFPPISTSSMPEHVGDLGLNGDSSRTPSHSPLPTPASSQTRVADGGKPRSRKTSQTTPDNVDLLDVTDPWGTNWHHESPYDIGQPSSSNVDLDGHGKRTRRASMTAAQSKHKSMTPSPLSQSTSAVHLHPPEPTNIQLPRKLSKRRTPGLDSIFGSQLKEDDRKVVSAPATPVERICLSDPTPPDPASLPKRMSVAPPVSYPLSLQPQTSSSTPKKEKRGSVLGRLVKKFSILRKPNEEYGGGDREYSWHHVSSDDANNLRNRQSFDTAWRLPSPEKSEGIKRIPAPSIQQPTVSATPEKDQVPPVDRSSFISLEAPFSIGKLTIANPDSPESEKGTPALANAPLLPQKTKNMHSHNHSALQSGSLSPNPHHAPTLDQLTPPEPQTRQQYDKPLPIPSTPSSSQSGTPLPLPQIPLVEEDTKTLPIRSQTISSTATRATPTIAPSEFQAKEAPVAETSPTLITRSLRDSHADSPTSRNNEPPHSSTSPQDSSVLRSRSRDHTEPDMLPQPTDKKLPSPVLNTRLSATTATVPFPSTPVAQSPDAMTSQERINSYLSYSDSPYSASSVLANPPTPYNDRATIPLTPEAPLPPALPAKPPKETKRTSRDPSPGRVRQTETFKLVRNLSGNVYASSETIVAAGQQWEVVESNEAKGKNRSSSKKEKDHSRRESKSEAKHKGEETGDLEPRQRSRSHRYSKLSSQETSTIPMPKSSARTSSRRNEEFRHPEDHRRQEDRRRQEELHRQEEIRRQEEHKRLDDHRRKEEYRRQEEYKRQDEIRRQGEQRRLEERNRQEDQRRHDERRRQDDYRHHDEHSRRDEHKRRDEKRYSADHRSSRKREDHADRKTEQKHSGSSTSDSYGSQPFPVQSVLAVPQPDARPLERRTSTSARPTSELPSAAELNALRAKEAWEMERLWKARSMYGAELNAGAVHSIPAASSSSLSDNLSTQSATYGSSHTAFLVQSPFQTPVSNIYHSMPNKPPPIIYPSPASIPSLHDSLSSYDPYDRNSYRQPYPFPNYTMTPPNNRASSSLSRPPLANPLPEPPRESSFQLAPVTTIQPSNGRSGDYWAKYTGITTAH